MALKQVKSQTTCCINNLCFITHFDEKFRWRKLWNNSIIFPVNDIQHNIYTFALHRNPISEVKRGGVISIFDRSFELSHVLSLLLDILVINKVFESKSDFLFFVPILRVSCILTYFKHPLRPCITKTTKKHSSHLTTYSNAS